MNLIIAGVMFFAIMGGWFLSNSWMHPDFQVPMKAALIVVSTISAALIVAGVLGLVF